MEFFTEVYENRMEETLQGALTANVAKEDTTKLRGMDTSQSGIPPKWDYCHSHRLCQHGSATCRYPAPNHKHEATALRAN